MSPHGLHIVNYRVGQPAHQDTDVMLFKTMSHSFCKVLSVFLTRTMVD